MMVSMKKRKNKSQGDRAWDQAGSLRMFITGLSIDPGGNSGTSLALAFPAAL